jgi:hypothetical protein
MPVIRISLFTRPRCDLALVGNSWRVGNRASEIDDDMSIVLSLTRGLPEVMIRLGRQHIL